MRPHAKLRKDLVSSKATVDGATVHTIKDPITGTYFRLREPEFWLINQLDGERSPNEVAQRFRDKFNLNITAENVEQFISAIEKLFFLESGRSEQQISRKSYGLDEKKSMAGRLLFIQIKAFDPTRLLDRVMSVYRHFHNRFWWTLQLAVIVVGLWLLASNPELVRFSFSDLLTFGHLVTFIMAMFILIVVHEFSHAIVCRYHGGEVKRMGFLLMYFQPCFFSDLSDAWLFEKKSQRLAVTWAGPYSQLILLSLSVIIWRLTVVGTFVNQLAWMTMLVSAINFLFNFNPLIKLDGYYLLSDWVDIPNLRSKAFAYLGNVFKRRLLGWPVEPVAATRRHKRIFSTYSVLAFAYSFLLIGYIVYLVGRFLTAQFGGPGFILLFAVLVFILRDVIIGILKGVIQHIKYMKDLLKKPVRLVSYIVVFVVVFVVFLAVPFPHRVSGEVTVQPMSVFTLTLNDLGMLESKHQRGGSTPQNKASFIQLTANEMAVLDVLPLAKDGQSVQTGDTLAILVSSQTTHEIVSAQAELEKLQGELTLLQAQPKQEEIDECEAAIRGATARLTQAESDLARSEGLAEKKLIAQDQLETMRSSVEIAKAELASRESALRLLTSPPRPEEEQVLQHEIEKQEARVAFLRRQAEAQLIVAPFSGVVSSKPNDGNILTLSDARQVELLTPVSDFEIPLVAEGQKAKVKLRAYPNMIFDGTVVRIPKATDMEESNFPVSVVVSNDDSLLQKGMTGYAKIEIGEAPLVTLAYRKLLSNIRVEFWSWW